MNRALRAATIGVLLLGPVTLSACSSGQVNQTALQVRDKTGQTGQVGDLILHKVTLAYPQGGRYATGADAVLQMAIVNEGGKPDVLVSISGPGFQGVRVTGTGPQGFASRGTSAAGSTSASATGSTGGATTTSGSASPTGSATTTGSATSAAALPTEAPSSSTNIEIPAGSAIFLGQNAPHVTLVGLTRPVTAAQALPITFTFRDAGSVTLDVIVDNPSSVISRTSAFNFEPHTEASVPANKAGGGTVPTAGP